MPAFAPGHPYFEVYQNTIARLIEAAAAALSVAEIVAYRGFLNEIVSHRRLAFEVIEEMRGDFADLRKEALMFGTVNMNVYVAGFANCLAEEKSLTFREYLARHAPYTTETELARWFEEKGIVVKGDAELKAGAEELPDILHMLEVANAGGGWNRKEGTLILHDAVQVAALARDIRMGRRAVTYSGDGDRCFRFIVTGLARSEVLSVDDNSVGHVGCLVGTGFGLFGGPTQGLTFEREAMSVM
jgi:hypothetical protein